MFSSKSKYIMTYLTNAPRAFDTSFRSSLDIVERVLVDLNTQDVGVIHHSQIDK